MTHVRRSFQPLAATAWLGALLGCCAAAGVATTPAAAQDTTVSIVAQNVHSNPHYDCALDSPVFFG
jgi:hypothetical protein